jgi:hypothetical protein
VLGITPASELAITTATPAEKEAYERFRWNYERGWSQVFDPIALQLTLSDDRQALDLSVLPLTVGSDYRQIMAAVGEATLSPRARWVGPDSVFHFALAIDPESEALSQWNSDLSGFFPGLEFKPLAWMGPSLSLELSEGVFWKALATAGGLSDTPYDQMPALLRIESKSPMRLALFLTAIKAAMQTSAPGMVNWETRKHNEQPYVVISENEEAPESNLQIYYAATGKALLIAMSEEALKRGLEREQVALSEKAIARLPEAQHLLAESTPSFLHAMSKLEGGPTLQERRMRQAWRSIPILNEWRRLFPERNPMTVHREKFGEALGGPEGEGYRWNADAFTMESVAYGYRAKPRQGEKETPLFDNFETLFDNFETLAAAFAFEDDGLRLRFAMGPEKRVTAAVEKEQ